LMCFTSSGIGGGGGGGVETHACINKKAASPTGEKNKKFFLTNGIFCFSIDFT